MEDYLTQALSQAAELVSRAVPCTQRCRLAGDWCSSPAAFSVAAHRGEAPETVAKDLAAHIDVTDSWFDRVTVTGGYLNFRLSHRWYSAVAAEPVVPGPAWRQSVPPIPVFPAAIHSGDWRFLCRSGRNHRTPEAQLAARQDQGNPAWLVRYTGRRLSGLAERERGERPEGWSETDRRLLRSVAEYPGRSVGSAPALSHYLTGLAQQLWKTRDSAPTVQKICAGVLTAGYQQLAEM